eukprot:576267_1
MAVMAISVLKSFKNICNIFIFFALFYIIFGIFGVYFMSGILHKRCYAYDDSGVAHASNVLCYDDQDCITADTGFPTCLSRSPNPYHDIFSFDNIFFASLQIFIASSGHWAILMAYIDETYSDSSITIYWFVLTYINFFVLLPLLLAFISDNFNDINLAKNGLYLKLKKNTLFTCATANVIFYKFSISDKNKVYFARLASTSPDINPLLHYQEKHYTKQRKQNIELQPMTTSILHQSAKSSIDESIREITVGSEFDVRDERLVMMAIRKSLDTQHTVVMEGKWRQKIYTFVNSVQFEIICLVLIVSDVICLCVPNPNLSTTTIERLALTNDIFIYLFLLELILRIGSVGGITSYWKRSSILVKCDGLLIIVSVLVHIIYIAKNDTYNNPLRGIISLRLFRILSLFKHSTYLSSFNRMTNMIIDAFSSMVWLLLILFLFLFVLGYFGTSLYHSNHEYHNAFNNIIFSMLTTFQIATGDDWVHLLSNTIALFHHSMWSLFFFGIIIILGVFIFPNYFIAVCIGSIDKYQSEDAEILQCVMPTATRLREHKMLNSEKDLALLIRKEIQNKRKELGANRLHHYLLRYRDRNVMFGRSLKCFIPNNKYRRCIHRIVTNIWYVRFIELCIILNALVFGMYNMNDILERSDEYNTLYAINITFIIVFCIEIILHIITFGFMSSASSLTRNWSRLPDEKHKQQWRMRCVAVWKLMRRYDADYNVNSNVYHDDLGIYDIIKSHHGLVIVWCVIPSCGLEIRILFYENKWRTIYCCKQYHHMLKTTAQTPHSRDESESDTSYTVTDDDDDDDDGDAKHHIPITRTGYGPHKKRNKRRKHKYNHDPKKEVIRKWEKWALRKGALSSIDRKDRAKFAMDESVDQLLISVSLNYKNTNAFVCDNWNILDAIVVFCSILSLMLHLKFWSTLRALRLFRVVLRNNKMRKIFSSIRRCLPALLLLLLFIMLVYLILSIIGLHLLYSVFDNHCACNHTLALTIDTQPECTSLPGVEWNDIYGNCKCMVPTHDSSALSQEECNGNPVALSWSTSSLFQFNNISSSLCSVFLISRGANWGYFISDLEMNMNILSSGSYFLVVVFLGQFCLCSLFMAMMITNYNRYYNEESKLLINYKQQKTLQRVNIFISTFGSKYCKISPFINLDHDRKLYIFKYRTLCHRIVDSSAFRYLMYIAIICNVLICSSFHYTYMHPGFDADVVINRVNNISSIAFTALYSMEIILRLIAHGFTFVWSYHSLRCCGVIVILSWYAICMHYVWLDGAHHSRVIVPITSLMIFRIIIAIRYFESFWSILKWTRASLFYLSIVMFMMLYTFAVFARYIFGDAMDINYTSSQSQNHNHEDAYVLSNTRDAFYFLYIYLFNAGDSWTAGLIQLMNASNSHSQWIILFFMLLYFVLMIFYSIFFAIMIDMYTDWREVQSISNELCNLNQLQSQWKSEIIKLREIYINHQIEYCTHHDASKSSQLFVNYVLCREYKEFISDIHLFNTYIPATKLLHMLSQLPSPIGFKELDLLFIPSNLSKKENRKIPSAKYKKLAMYFADLNIIIIKNHRATSAPDIVDDSCDDMPPLALKRGYTQFYNYQWEYIVNFAHVIQAFTHKLLFKDNDVDAYDILLNEQQDEQFIVDWFRNHWDSC